MLPKFNSILMVLAVFAIAMFTACGGGSTPPSPPVTATATVTFDPVQGGTWGTPTQTVNVGTKVTTTLTLASGYIAPKVTPSDQTTPVDVQSTTDSHKWSVTVGPVAKDVALDATLTLASETVTCKDDPYAKFGSATLSANYGDSVHTTLTLTAGATNGNVVCDDASVTVQLTDTTDALVKNVVAGPIKTSCTLTASAVAPPAPKIVSVTPANGAVNVKVGYDPSVTFDQPMSADSVNAHVWLKDAAGNRISGVSGLLNPTTAFFMPSKPFTQLTTYSLCVDGSVQDTYGVPLGQDVVATTFVTEDNVPPSLVKTIAVSKTRISMFFSEPIATIQVCMVYDSTRGYELNEKTTATIDANDATRMNIDWNEGESFRGDSWAIIYNVANASNYAVADTTTFVVPDGCWPFALKRHDAMTCGLEMFEGNFYAYYISSGIGGVGVLTPTITCFNGKGDVRWEWHGTHQFTNVTSSHCAVLSIGGKLLLFNGTDKELYAAWVDPQTGTLVSDKSFTGNMYLNCQWFSSDGNYISVGSTSYALFFDSAMNYLDEADVAGSQVGQSFFAFGSPYIQYGTNYGKTTLPTLSLPSPWLHGVIGGFPEMSADGKSFYAGSSAYTLDADGKTLITAWSYWPTNASLLSWRSSGPGGMEYYSFISIASGFPGIISKVDPATGNEKWSMAVSAGATLDSGRCFPVASDDIVVLVGVVLPTGPARNLVVLDALTGNTIQ